MTSLNDIVSVTVTTATATPSQQGFGTPMVAAHHALPGALVRTYSTFQGAVSDGVTATAYPSAYRALQSAFSQNPRPSKVKLGKRTNVAAQVVQLVTTTVEVGAVASLKVNGVQASYTVQAADALADVLAGLEAAIVALALDITTDDTSGTEIEVTADNAGEVFAYTELTNVSFTDVSTDGGIATDLAALRAADADWYGLFIDTQNETETIAAAAWAEADGAVIFFADAVDAECLDSGDTDDVGSTAKAAGYDRTVLIYSQNPGSYMAGGWLCDGLPDLPGSRTWAFQKIAGATVSTLTETEQTALHNKNINTYTTIAGLPTTLNGVAASGEYIDVVRFRDWFVARLKESIFQALYNNKKLPYTNQSVQVIVGVINNVISQGVDRGGISTDIEPVITYPDVNDVSATDRGNRLLPDVRIFFRLARAIHKINFEVTLSV